MGGGAGGMGDGSSGVEGRGRDGRRGELDGERERGRREEKRARRGGRAGQRGSRLWGDEGGGREAVSGSGRSMDAQGMDWERSRWEMRGMRRLRRWGARMADGDEEGEAGGEGGGWMEGAGGGTRETDRWGLIMRGRRGSGIGGVSRMRMKIRGEGQMGDRMRGERDGR
ncbi:hypothetical protein Tco_0087192 [Tanacetum coccineum]